MHILEQLLRRQKTLHCPVEIATFLRRPKLASLAIRLHTTRQRTLRRPEDVRDFFNGIPDRGRMPFIQQRPLGTQSGILADFRHLSLSKSDRRKAGN